MKILRLAVIVLSLLSITSSVYSAQVSYSILNTEEDPIYHWTKDRLRLYTNLNSINRPQSSSSSSSTIAAESLEGVIMPFLLGDFNLDGRVSANDISALSANYGGTNKSYLQGDMNDDGNVNVYDIGPFSGNYGSNSRVEGQDTLLYYHEELLETIYADNSRAFFINPHSLFSVVELTNSHALSGVYTITETLSDGRVAQCTQFDASGRVIRKDLSDGHYQILSNFWANNQPGTIQEYSASGLLLVTDQYDASANLMNRAYEYSVLQLASNAYTYGLNYGTYLCINDRGDIVYGGRNLTAGGFESYLYNSFNGSIVALPYTGAYGTGPHTLNANGEVAWVGYKDWYYNLFYYNGVTTTQLTNYNNSWVESAQLNDNGKIVYYMNPSGGSGGKEIFYYNGTDTIQLTNDAYDDWSPKISNRGDIVWKQYKNGWDIYLYNGSSITQLRRVNDYYDDNNPQINANGQVVWEGYNGDSTSGIYLYDGISTRRIATSWYPQTNLNSQINDNGYIVWQGWDGVDYDIYLYDGITTKQLTSNSYDDINPKINNAGQVIWVGSDGIYKQIYLYNGYSVQQLTSDPYNHLSPEINNNGEITWVDVNGGLFRARPNIVIDNQEALARLDVQNTVSAQFSDHLSGEIAGYDGLPVPVNQPDS